MDEATDLAEKLRQEGEKLEAYVRSMRDDERSVEVYTEGSLWTVHHILIHLISAETAFLHLFREIQSGGPGVPVGFSIDQFNENEQARLNAMLPEQVLAAFRDTRRRMADLVSSFTAEDLERQGRHPFLGVTSLREMVKLIYIHDQTHLRDVRKALATR